MPEPSATTAAMAMMTWTASGQGRLRWRDRWGPDGRGDPEDACGSSPGKRLISGSIVERAALASDHPGSAAATCPSGRPG